MVPEFLWPVASTLASGLAAWGSKIAWDRRKRVRDSVKVARELRVTEIGVHGERRSSLPAEWVTFAEDVGDTPHFSVLTIAEASAVNTSDAERNDQVLRLSVPKGSVVLAIREWDYLDAPVRVRSTSPDTEIYAFQIPRLRPGAKVKITVVLGGTLSKCVSCEWFPPPPK